MDQDTGEATGTADESTFFNMSDEDFEKMDVSDIPADEGTGEQDEGDTESESEETAEEEHETEESEEGSEESSDEDESEESESDEDEDTGSEEESSEDDGEESEESSEEDPDTPDYKAVYDDIFSPFKANGKEIKVENVQEARQLMQMGANYSKKMAAIKPNLKTLRLLEDNNLMSDDKINYLIDLASGKEGAIKQLLRESKIDPMEIDLEADGEESYRPSQREVDEQAMALDDVISDIRGTDHFEALVDDIGKTWDDKSRKALKENPQLLTLLNDHKASGIYDQVADEVNRRTLLGSLNGMSTLEAYDQIGREMDAAGKFGTTGSQSQAPAPEKKRVVPSKKKAQDAALKSKKRAAGATRKTPSSGVPADFNPLSMSDEEFEKLSSKYS